MVLDGGKLNIGYTDTQLRELIRLCVVALGEPSLATDGLKWFMYNDTPVTECHAPEPCGGNAEGSWHYARGDSRRSKSVKAHAAA